MYKMILNLKSEKKKQLIADDKTIAFRNANIFKAKHLIKMGCSPSVSITSSCIAPQMLFQEITKTVHLFDLGNCVP